MLTVVLYHNIVNGGPEFEADLGVSTRLNAFQAHLEYYRKNYEIVDLDAVLKGPLPRNALLITFDDFYRSVLTVAENILSPIGIPAVFFVNPGLLGRNAVSLDAILYWYSRKHGLPALCDALALSMPQVSSVGELISGPMAALGATQRTALRDRLLSKEGADSSGLAGRSPSLESEDLSRLPPLGIEIGNHTTSHVHCRALSDDEHNSEIVEAKQKLESLSRSRVRSFSFPYGHERDATPGVLNTLRDSGHQAIFLVHARSNRFRKAPDIWYRISVHNEPAGTLFRKLSVLPLVRSAKAATLGRVGNVIAHHHRQ
jgi:peptidoglycan/xylan/chitin deacetylase (PgdA/CDA1 family)